MKSKKLCWRIGTFILSILLGFLFFSGCQENFARASVEATIAIMTTADLQSCITPYTVDLNGKKITVGGLERIASVAKKIRSQVDGALLLSSGDDMIAPLFPIFRGEPEMRGMSLAGYDIVTPGNHEFDNGVQAYRNALSFADFDVVSANLIVKDSKLAEKIKPYVIKEIAGIKIGVFGMMTSDLLKICKLDDEVSVDKDIVSVAQDVVNNLASKGCDIIIGLTHIGTRLDRELAQKVNGIDIIVGGHSHEYVYETIGNTIIVQDGARGKYLGVLRFTFKDGKIINPVWQRIFLDSTAGCDNEIHELMNQYMDKYRDSLSHTIGESAVDLDARKDIVRSRESNIGNLIADSWLEWFTDADVALVNGGSIRGDKIYPRGKITYLTVNEILAFRNEVVEVEMSGADLKQALEVSASALRIKGDGCQESYRPASGGFFQIGGLRITIDITRLPFCAIYSGKSISKIINPGSRIVSVEVRQNGRWVPLNLSAHYIVLVNGWTADGGDGHYIFLREDISKRHTTVFTTDILTNYIRRHIKISPQIDGRIKFVRK